MAETAYHQCSMGPHVCYGRIIRQLDILGTSLSSMGLGASQAKGRALNLCVQRVKKVTSQGTSNGRHQEVGTELSEWVVYLGFVFQALSLASFLSRGRDVSVVLTQAYPMVRSKAIPTLPHDSLLGVPGPLGMEAILKRSLSDTAIGLPENVLELQMDYLEPMKMLHPFVLGKDASSSAWEHHLSHTKWKLHLGIMFISN